MRRRFLEQGCALTFICWVAAALVGLGGMLGDCFPTQGHPCATDHQRDMGLVKIILGAAALNIGGLLILGVRRGDSEND